MIYSIPPAVCLILRGVDALMKIGDRSSFLTALRRSHCCATWRVSPSVVESLYLE